MAGATQAQASADAQGQAVLTIYRATAGSYIGANLILETNTTCRPSPSAGN